ncbi:MAG: hypothetical protein HFG15_02435 [Bacilli bacterium]|nr:hypothetical protein [Bacilli bacterium]
MNAYEMSIIAALQRTLDRGENVLEAFSKLELNDFSNGALTKINKIVKDYKKQQGVRENIVSKIKEKYGVLVKILVPVGLIGAIAVSLTGCGNDSKDKEPGSDKNNIVLFDEDYWSRNALADQTLIDQGISIKKLLGENGLLEEGRFSNDKLAFYSILAGFEAKTDARIKSLNISEFVSNRADALKYLEEYRQSLNTGLMTNQFKVDWSSIFPKKYDAKMLNELQALYQKLNTERSNENRDELVKTLDKIQNGSAGYSEMAMFVATSYAQYFHSYKDINQTVRNTFIDHLDKACAERTENTDFIEENHSSYSSAFTSILENITEMIEIEKATDESKSDGGKSLKEIAIEISKVKVENKKNASEIASQASDSHEYTEAMKKQKGSQMTAEDYKNLRTDPKTGKTTINAGVADYNEHKGQEVDTGFHDENNQQSNKETVEQLVQRGANDALAGLPPQSSDSNYMLGYNSVKNNITPPEDDNVIDNNQDTQDNYYPGFDSGNVLPNNGGQSQPNENSNSATTTTTTEEVYYSDLIMGADGNWYLSDGTPVQVEASTGGMSR